MKIFDSLETIQLLKSNIDDIEKEILKYRERGYVDKIILYARIGVVRIYVDILKEKIWDGLKEIDAKKED